MTLGMDFPVRVKGKIEIGILFDDPDGIHFRILSAVIYSLGRLNDYWIT